MLHEKKGIFDTLDSRDLFHVLQAPVERAGVVERLDLKRGKAAGVSNPKMEFTVRSDCIVR